MSCNKMGCCLFLWAVCQFCWWNRLLNDSWCTERQDWKKLDIENKKKKNWSKSHIFYLTLTMKTRRFLYLSKSYMISSTLTLRTRKRKNYQNHIFSTWHWHWEQEDCFINIIYHFFFIDIEKKRKKIKLSSLFISYLTLTLRTWKRKRL